MRPGGCCCWEAIIGPRRRNELAVRDSTTVHNKCENVASVPLRIVQAVRGTVQSRKRAAARKSESEHGRTRFQFPLRKIPVEQFVARRLILIEFDLVQRDVIFCHHSGTQPAWVRNASGRQNEPLHPEAAQNFPASSASFCVCGVSSASFSRRL